MPFFANATVGNISGGHFQEFHGPVQFINVSWHPQSLPSHVARPRLTQGPSSAARASQDDPRTPSSYEDGARLALKITDLFSTIDELLDPYHGAIFTNIRSDLRRMKKLVQFSYRAYEACQQTTFGSFIGRILVRQIQECADALIQTQTQIEAVVSGWPSTKKVLICGLPRLVFGIFVDWMEAPDGVLIRKAIDDLGECIVALTAFRWVNRFLSQKDSALSMRNIEEFFDGPTMYKPVKIEKILVIEPLGLEMALPIRFIDSFETIHFFLQEACRNTKGRRFIDNRQYQLDDSDTNTYVDPAQFRSSLQAGKSFEVTVRVPHTQLGSGLSYCPRCGEDNTDNDSRNGFICCTGCRVLFNAVEALPSRPAYIEDQDDPYADDPEDDQAESSVDQSLPGEPRPVAASQDVTRSRKDDGGPQRQNSNMVDLIDGLAEYPSNYHVWTLFRRIRVEVMVPPLIAEQPSSTLVLPPQTMLEAMEEFNYNTVPPEFRKDGPDWFAAFNPKIKRTSDIEALHSFQHDSVVCTVHFSPDGRFLATGCNRTAQIFDVKNGEKVCELGHDNEGFTGDLFLRSVRFSPDGRMLVTGAEDRQIRVWDISRRRIRYVFDGHQQEIYSIDISIDGRLIASGSGDCTVRIWDIVDNSCKVLTITDNTDTNTDSGVTSVAISPSMRLVAGGSLDNVIRIWDVMTGQLLERLRGHSNSVYSVVFTPDGKGLLTASLDNTLKRWDVSHLDSPEGRRKAAADPDGRDRLEVERMERMEKEGKVVANANCLMDFVGHKDYAICAAMSSDSRWVLSGSKDRCVHLWDSQTATLQMLLQGHKNSVIGLDLNPSNDMLATASGDSTARIWRLVRI